MRKRYRVIYNNDGGTLFRPFAPNTDVPFSVEGFLDKTIGQLVGTQVDVLTWTLGTDPGRRPGNQGVGRATNQYCHETDVGRRGPEQETVVRDEAGRRSRKPDPRPKHADIHAPTPRPQRVV